MVSPSFIFSPYAITFFGLSIARYTNISGSFIGAIPKNDTIYLPSSYPPLDLTTLAVPVLPPIRAPSTKEFLPVPTGSGGCIQL